MYFWCIPLVFIYIVYLLACQVELPEAIQVFLVVSFVCWALLFPFVRGCFTSADFYSVSILLPACHHSDTPKSLFILTKLWVASYRYKSMHCPVKSEWADCCPGIVWKLTRWISSCYSLGSTRPKLVEPLWTDLSIKSRQNWCKQADLYFLALIFLSVDGEWFIKPSPKIFVCQEKATITPEQQTPGRKVAS